MRSITPTSASFSIQTSTRQGWVSHLSRRKLRAAAAMMAAGSSQCGLLSRLRVLSSMASQSTRPARRASLMMLPRRL